MAKRRGAAIAQLAMIVLLLDKERGTGLRVCHQSVPTNTQLRDLSARGPYLADQIL